jgi:hypothetical protein
MVISDYPLCSSVTTDHFSGFINHVPIESEHAQTYSEKQHAYHESWLGVEVDIYPATGIHENKRRDNDYDTPRTYHDYTVKCRFVISLFCQSFHDNYLIYLP